MSKVITRFAPSPTGYLHIGGARTALFNWLFARSQGGEFYLRIEDTDKTRHVEEVIQPIINGLAWLGLDHDGEIVHQSDRIARHAEVARQLLASGHAYKCYVSAEQLETERKEAQQAKKTFKFRSPWRDRRADFYAVNPDGSHQQYVIRIKMPEGGSTTIHDLVQGEVTVQNDVLDDFIILRADGTPTYMLAVVVDDHDAGVTHVIRGDDHLNNAFRQLPIYRAMGWDEPHYGHLPLIFDELGKKLSKRHGAAGLETYRDGGYLPNAVFNYLLRMGWGHGDHEIFTRDEALKLFSIDQVGKAPARIDQKRLDYLNGVYIQKMTSEEFLLDLMRFITEHPNDATYDLNFVQDMVPLVKERSKTLVEARSYIDMTISAPVMRVSDMKGYLAAFRSAWDREWTAEGLKQLANDIADIHDVKLKHVVEPIRLVIFGQKISPPLFEAMMLLGRGECRERIDFALEAENVM